MLVASDPVVLHSIKGKVVYKLVIISAQSNVTKHPSCNFIEVCKIHIASITGHYTKSKCIGKKRGTYVPRKRATMKKLIEEDLLTLPLRTLQGLTFHTSCLSQFTPVSTDLNQVCNFQTHTQ